MTENYGTMVTMPHGGHYGPDCVYVRSPRLGDLMAYLQDGGGAAKAKNNLVQSVCEPGTDLRSLPVGDREHLFATLRTMVNSSMVSGKATCTREGCGKAVPYSVELTRCRVDCLPPDFRPHYEMAFPACGESRVVDMLTVGREELMEEYVAYYEAADGGGLPHSDLAPGDLRELARYACMLGGVVSRADVDREVAFLRGLAWPDFEALLLYDVSFATGPRLSVDVACKGCGSEYRLSLRTDSSFFGLTLEGLLRRHKFLAKAGNIGFGDFMGYTVPMMDAVTEAETSKK